jgi:hypothetical protein
MAEELCNGAAVHQGFHDLADLRAFARKLIEHWDRWQMKPFHMKGEYDVGGPILWSFTNHVVNLMRTVLDLSEKDRGIIAVPLIRLIVENTMTGVWLYLEPSNTWAILTEGFQKRKAAINGVIEIEDEGSINRMSLRSIRYWNPWTAQRSRPSSRGVRTSKAERPYTLSIVC